MKKFSSHVILIISFLIGCNNLSAQSEDVISIKNQLNKWMKAYNQKDLSGSVSIFAENFIGYYAGHTDQTVSTIKEQNDEVFKNKFLKATLSMEAVEIVTGGDLAYVIIKQKWSFKPSISDKAQVAFEKGILIFKKENEGKWKIIRSSTFPVNPNK